MNRLFKLLEKLDEVIKKQEGKLKKRDETLEWERIHMVSSARIAWILAMERDVEPEIAACAAAVHDYGRIMTGQQKDHAEQGYKPVKLFLTECGLFSEKEIDLISLAVKKHSRKTEIGTEIEEIVKDSDVIDCFQYGIPFDRPEKEERYNAWKNNRNLF